MRVFILSAGASTPTRMDSWNSWGPLLRKRLFSSHKTNCRDPQQWAEVVIACLRGVLMMSCPK